MIDIVNDVNFLMNIQQTCNVDIYIGAISHK